MKRLTIALGLLALVGASCSDTAAVDSTSSTSTTDSSVGTSTSSTVTSTCTNMQQMNGISTSNLSTYFERVVQTLVGPVTYCMSITGANWSPSGEFFIEYEDNSGVHTIDETNVFYGNIQLNGNTTTIQMVWEDSYGFTQVKGTAGSNGTFNGALSYYNFPSYQDALNSSIQQAATDCQNGTYTVAECLGYNFPSTYWWNDSTTYTSPQQALITQAQAILSNSSETPQIGTLSVDISQILNQD